MAKALDDFKRLSPLRRALVVVLGTVGFALITVAQRDIQRRPDDELRGPKLIWRLISLNMLGAIGYLLWGRQAA